MKSYEATTRIEASPETVWAILVDGPGLMQWKSGVQQFEGTVAPGEKLKVKWEGSDRVFPVKVTQFSAPRSMHWVGGMPLGLFTGTRSYTLTPTSESEVEFAMREEFSGLLAPLIARSIPDLQPAFDAFAGDLKRRAERAA